MFTKCNCCGDSVTCTIFSNDTTLANFTQVSGTWTKPAGSIQTTSANAVIIHNTAHPQGLPTGCVRLNSIDLPVGGKVRYLGGYTDINNHYYIEYFRSANLVWDMVLGYVLGGADVPLETFGPVPGVSGTKGLCWNGTRLSGQAGSSVSFGIDGVQGMDAPMTAALTGTQVGIQVIGNTGTFSFDSLTFSGANATSCDNVEGGCNTCHENATGTPGEVSVYFTGVANKSCGTCASFFNGTTFILTNPNEPPAIPYATRSCEFIKPIAACAGNLDQLRFQYRGSGATDTAYRLRVSSGPDGLFEGNIYGTLRTASRCDEVLTVTGAGSASGGNFCDWTGATVVITPNMAV